MYRKSPIAVKQCLYPAPRVEPAHGPPGRRTRLLDFFAVMQI